MSLHGRIVTERARWGPFFAALDRSGLEVSWDTDDPAAACPIPAA
jgi:hypothetical protein